MELFSHCFDSHLSEGLSQWFGESEGNSGLGFRCVDLVTKVWFLLNLLQQTEGVPQSTTGSQTPFLRVEKHAALLTTSNLMKCFFIRSPMRFSFKIWDFTPNAQILKFISHFKEACGKQEVL